MAVSGIGISDGKKINERLNPTFMRVSRHRKQSSGNKLMSFEDYYQLLKSCPNILIYYGNTSQRLLVAIVD